MYDKCFARATRATVCVYPFGNKSLASESSYLSCLGVLEVAFISPMRSNFLGEGACELRTSCSSCTMLSGCYWAANQCRPFCISDGCSTSVAQCNTGDGWTQTVPVEFASTDYDGSLDVIDSQDEYYDSVDGYSNPYDTQGVGGVGTTVASMESSTVDPLPTSYPSVSSEVSQNIPWEGMIPGMMMPGMMMPEMMMRGMGMPTMGMPMMGMPGMGMVNPVAAMQTNMNAMAPNWRVPFGR